METMLGRRVSHHTNVSLDILEAAVKKQGSTQDLIERDGKPLSLKKALACIKEWRAKGYKYAPPCDQVGPDGACAGHPEYTQAQGR